MIDLSVVQSQAPTFDLSLMKKYQKALNASLKMACNLPDK